MITVEHMTRRFADVVAVDDVSFRVERGEVVDSSVDVTLEVETEIMVDARPVRPKMTGTAKITTSL